MKTLSSRFTPSINNFVGIGINAKKSFETVSITERGNGEEYLVLGKEANLINAEPYTAQCMFVWRKENSEWKLLREYIELER